MERNHLDQTKPSLNKKQSELELLCQPHEAVRKIEEIAAGLLRKNYRSVQQQEEVEARIKELIPRIYHTKKQMKALEDRVARDKVGTRYRVTVTYTLSNSSMATIIADAILFDPQVVQLVARSDGNIMESF